jgi:hypothetical protein
MWIYIGEECELFKPRDRVMVLDIKISEQRVYVRNIERGTNRYYKEAWINLEDIERIKEQK